MQCAAKVAAIIVLKKGVIPVLKFVRFAQSWIRCRVPSGFVCAWRSPLKRSGSFSEK